MTQQLNGIVAEAVRVTGVPVAFVTLINAEGEEFKACRGWNVTSIPAASGFARRITGESDVVIVPDTTRDPRFSAHPLVTGHPNIRFFCGVPLMDDGQFVGALCVVDRSSRTLAMDQVTALRMLARQVMREFEVARGVGELEERFREFFEQTDDLVMTISNTGRLVHSNETVFNTLGFSREEMSAHPLDRFIDDDERDHFRVSLAGVFEAGQPRIVETVFVTSSGRRLAVEGTLRPRVIGGVTVMVRVIFRDITERKQFEADLGNARDGALDAARAKTQFLTNVSHEIRTPMNGIIGMLDLLGATAMDEEQRDYASQARQSADHLLAIVNNILYVSNVEAGGLGSSNVDFDLYRMLYRVTEVIKIGALGKDVDVALEYDRALPAILRGQQSKLRQIVTNLMDNAIKFTGQGRVVLRVGQQTETETHRVIRFEICDTGAGIAQEDRLLLFEKFSQVESGSTRTHQGTGLGLATARHLVETLGGLIDVESTPGEGSTFWFTVPFPKQAHGRNPIASSDLDFKGKRVILVDQLPTSRKTLLHYLSNIWEMRVDVVANGQEALAMLRRDFEADRIRTVIYDQIPDLDYQAFAREVRADARISSTSLVHLLGIGAPVNREAMRQAGINAYISRPVGQSDLFDALAVAFAQDAIAMSRPATQLSDSRSRPAPVTNDMKKKVRVLLAEDNFLNAKLTMQQLQKLGYDADSVPNGKDAVDAVAGGAYNIVLMDCQMPIMDGYQATVEIRRIDKQRGGSRRIIAMTANALPGDREKCLAAGMDDYLSKPTKHEELEAALARYFG